MTEPTTQELIDFVGRHIRTETIKAEEACAIARSIGRTMDADYARVDMFIAIAERLRAMQWRPVTDDEPAIGGTYLCRWQIDNPLPTTAAATRHDIHDWRENCDPRDNYCPPDFWMPLPQPPEGEK